jgi:hypothetical protein
MNTSGSYLLIFLAVFFSLLWLVPALDGFEARAHGGRELMSVAILGGYLGAFSAAIFHRRSVISTQNRGATFLEGLSLGESIGFVQGFVYGRLHYLTLSSSLNGAFIGMTAANLFAGLSSRFVTVHDLGSSEGAGWPC